jgi:predicted amidophosphoribosyltransferase
MNVLLIYVVGGALFLILAVVFYMHAVSTRKQVICPSCQERVRMEHDRIVHCPSCGASLS